MSRIPARPTLFLIAGPDGAGKTTFYETVLRSRVAAIAADRRTERLEAGESFVTETVFSHPSKLELLHGARSFGYRLVVFHLGLASADLAVARVRERIKEGGHTVPEDKIRTRFVRNQPLIREAVLMADYSSVYDASRLNQPPRLLLNLQSGSVEFCADDLPEWCRVLYASIL